MSSAIATAHSWAVPASGFDFLPLVGALAAVVLVRLVRRRLTGWSTAVAASAGTVWAWWVEAAGFTFPSLIALFVLVALTASPAPRRSP